MVRRNFIFDTIKSVFRKYGYQQIETPAMENLSTLMGKYGDEGDKLIFKILDSGEYIEKVKFGNLISDLIENLIQQDEQNLPERNDFLSYLLTIKKISSETDNLIHKWDQDMVQSIKNFLSRKITLTDFGFTSKNLTTQVSEKALRYDLTVPFARYVVMHQNEITFPFKRFQVQPVWRADRPQRGRYREFYQCDADVVGSPSLLNEAEFIMIYDEALSKLGLKDFTIKINNRKILSGIAEVIGKADNIIDLTVAIDKLDKIGLDGVIKELLEKGFTPEDIEKLKPVILLEGLNTIKLESLREALKDSATGLKGCDEIETVFTYIDSCKLQHATLELDITLARGLNYYTGAIFEVKNQRSCHGQHWRRRQV